MFVYNNKLLEKKKSFLKFRLAFKKHKQVFILLWIDSPQLYKLSFRAKTGHMHQHSYGI